MRRSTFAVLAAALAVFAFAGFAAGPAVDHAAAKSFAITDITVESRVLPNGDLRVRETRTVEFSGDFSFVSWDIPKRGSEGIRFVGATAQGRELERTDDTYSRPPGAFAVSDRGDRVQIDLFFRLADTSAAFAIEYVAVGAAKRWDDTSELYWQFIGPETGVPSERTRVHVRLPRGVMKGEVRAWAHGPLWGEVTIEDDASVTLAVSPLPAHTFVEGRILFPRAALAAAPSTPGAREQAVLDEEQRLAEQANRERFWARVKLALWGLLGLALPLAAVVLVAWLYVRHGREHKPSFQAEYLREPPEPHLPPALAGFVWRMGESGKDDVAGTLLDLIDRGVIAIERHTVVEKKLLRKDETKTYRLTVDEMRLDGLLPYERLLLDFLFRDMAGGWSLVLSDLKDIAKKKKTSFASGYQGWTKQVKTEAERRGFLDASADRRAFIAAAGGFAAAVGAGAAGAFSGYYWFFLGIPMGIGVVLVARAVKRRSPEAAELHAQYQALLRYLKDFGRLQEKPPDAVVLWRQFLVFAVVFGIADEVVKNLRIKAPEVLEDRSFQTMSWMMLAPDGGGDSPFSSLSDGFSTAVKTATSSSSSGSGGGGGFSGGGGGGGGGGGFRAG